MNTDELIAHSRARFEHAVAKKVLKEKYQAKLMFASQGGMWQAGPELLNLLHVFSIPEVVILDLYDTPVRVDPQALYRQAVTHWQEQMNAWAVEFEQQSQNR
jgi:hypothetical protein